MKTSKITTTFATLNLVLFMSVSSIAEPLVVNTGDIVKTEVKKQIEAVKNTITEMASSVSLNEFSHLRFDVNKFNAENGVAELPLNSYDYLRFDACNLPDGITSEITELPLKSEFDYLHFSVTDFHTTSEISEMPLHEYEYLRFDVNKYSSEIAVDELPVD